MVRKRPEYERNVASPTPDSSQQAAASSASANDPNPMSPGFDANYQPASVVVIDSMESSPQEFKAPMDEEERVQSSACYSLAEMDDFTDLAESTDKPQTSTFRSSPPTSSQMREEVEDVAMEDNSQATVESGSADDAVEESPSKRLKKGVMTGEPPCSNMTKHGRKLSSAQERALDILERPRRRKSTEDSAPLTDNEVFADVPEKIKRPSHRARRAAASISKPSSSAAASSPSAADPHFGDRQSRRTTRNSARLESMAEASSTHPSSSSSDARPKPRTNEHLRVWDDSDSEVDRREEEARRQKLEKSAKSFQKAAVADVEEAARLRLAKKDERVRKAALAKKAQAVVDSVAAAARDAETVKAASKAKRTPKKKAASKEKATSSATSEENVPRKRTRGPNTRAWIGELPQESNDAFVKNPDLEYLNLKTKPPPVLNYTAANFNLADVNFGKHLHKIRGITSDRHRLHTWNQGFFEATRYKDEDEVEAAKVTLTEELEKSHKDALADKEPPLHSARYILPENAHEFRGENDAIDAPYQDPKTGKMHRKRPIPGSGIPRGLKLPEFYNGEEAVLSAESGATFYNFKDKRGTYWPKLRDVEKLPPPEKLLDYDPSAHSEPIEQIEVPVQPQPPIARPKLRRRVHFYQRRREVLKADAQKKRALASIEYSIAEILQQQQVAAARRKFNRRSSSCPPSFRHLLTPTDADAAAPAAASGANAGQPTASVRAGIPEVIVLRRPSLATADMSDAYLLDVQPDPIVFNRRITKAGDVTKAFWKDTGELPADYNCDNLLPQKVKNPIPFNLFADIDENDAPTVIDRFYSWLSENDNWKSVKFPYYRSIPTSFIDRHQPHVHFDENNSRTVLQFLSDDSAGLKKPSSQFAPGPGVPFPGHSEDMDMRSSNILFGGRKLWIFTPKRFREQQRKLERFLFRGEFMRCEAFQRHKMFLYHPRWLVAAGIPVFFHFQTEGDLMVVHEATYHMGLSVTATAATSWNSGSLEWLYYDLPNIVGNRDEECHCDEPSRANPQILDAAISLISAMDLVGQQSSIVGVSSDIFEVLCKAAPFSRPMVITDSSKACFACGAQFLVDSSYEKHRNKHAKGQKADRKAAEETRDSEHEEEENSEPEEEENSDVDGE